METMKPTVTMKYSDISSFEFAQAIQKIAQTPVDTKTACAIHRVTKALNSVRLKISADYQDKIVLMYGKKDEKGDVIRPLDNPNGFDVQEEKTEEFKKAQEDFGKTEAVLETKPLSMELLKDIKLSARDLEVLNNLFSDEETPVGLHSV
jgi:hypothetical protein